MQFQYNADYPGVSGPHGVPIAENPRDFPPVQPIPCARITTRVFHSSRNQVATVQNVLVRTMPVAPMPKNPDDFSSMSSDMSSSSSSFFEPEDGMKLDSSGPGEATPAAAIPPAAPDAALHQTNNVEYAYWIQRTIREAIYGRVQFAIILKRRAPIDGAEWEVTTEFCAVKEMSWQHIRKERDRLAEDPIKEVAAMQYIKKWFAESRSGVAGDTITNMPSMMVQAEQGDVGESFEAMRLTNIMMPLDLLSDERNLYSIMPYCDGGELFERLDMNERFSEDEARYWMDQVLNGIENLQHVGICHRDMSLENLLVHNNGALIIDMGMCLLLPYQDVTKTIEATFRSMNMNNALAEAIGPLVAQEAAEAAARNQHQSGKTRPRNLVAPQGTCGKWIYMSPEIYQNSTPFDGFAVDMWAAGVILFLMLTGFPPWERACATDDRFKYMTAGYLVQMLTEWELGLTSDAMDLLQRMLFLDPKDRLSLDQVRAHPWMVNGQRQGPR